MVAETIFPSDPEYEGEYTILGEEDDEPVSSNMAPEPDRRGPPEQGGVYDHLDGVRVVKVNPEYL